MNLIASFLAILAAAQTIVAFPHGSSHDVKTMAPVDVTLLVCDGDTNQCTASLNFFNNYWYAQWGVNVFHTSVFGVPDHKTMPKGMAPSTATSVECDGATSTCTATLDFSDGGWRAEWTAAVSHGPSSFLPKAATDPSGVTSMTCDGASFECIADLAFGDGNWVAKWDATVFGSPTLGSFLKQN